MKNFGYVLLLASVGFMASSCKLLPEQKAQPFAETEIRGDTIIHFHSLQKNLRAENDTLDYYWTRGGKIYITQGGSFSRLLHGGYTVFVANKMVYSGAFYQGLKSGIWKKWETGRLVSVYGWENGLLHGKYTIYNENGTIHESGSYSKGKKK